MCAVESLMRKLRNMSFLIYAVLILLPILLMPAFVNAQQVQISSAEVTFKVRNQENATWESISSVNDKFTVSAGNVVRIAVKVYNTGALEAKNLTVVVKEGDKVVDSKTIDVPANGNATVEIDWIPAKIEEKSIYVETAGISNRYTITVEKAESGKGKIEWIMLIIVFVISVAGLGYGLMLRSQILKEDNGTKAMQKVSKAIQIGAKAYLKKQLTTVAKLVIVLVILLGISAYLSVSKIENETFEIWRLTLGRALAFAMGAIFSGTVGYVGMTMATLANVKVAAAARTSFSDALRIGYRTGTIVGMLTDGLGLLGGTIIFMIYDIKAYEVLLGFGFGGSLLALFMRVGGGIYTKAADVGADLVGKVEKNIPEDDPRNAAVVADLVGDNVGDCAGMAADIFESYEVSMVSAMILGIAAFVGNTKMQFVAVLFPLTVRAIGVFSS
ncbi:MAG: sodium/proton-translocating pyrophosphatase, partial [Thermoplasmata archaeon]